MEVGDKVYYRGVGTTRVLGCEGPATVKRITADRWVKIVMDQQGFSIAMPEHRMVERCTA